MILNNRWFFKFWSDSQVLAVFEEGDLPVERTEPAVNVKDENDIIVIEKADSGSLFGIL